MRPYTCGANFTAQQLHSAQHDFTRRKAHLTEKIRLQCKRIFSGGGGRIRLHFHSLWGMKIEVLPPSSRWQATVHRTVAFGIFESVHPFFHHKKPPTLRIAVFRGGGGRIRTIEAKRSRFTVCPLWPLGNSPRYEIRSIFGLEPVDGLEPPTYCLQISCSTD